MKAASRLSPALVISLIALFVALGTGAWAVSSLPKHSVGTKQLKKKAVGSKQLKKKAVKTKNLADSSVATAKIAAGAVTADKVADGVIPTVPTVPQQPIAFAAKHTNPAVPGQGTLIQRTMSVPANGYLYIVASGDSELGPDDFITCSISVDGVTDGASSRLIGDSNNASDDCITNTVVPVAAGNRTVSFVGSGADVGVTYRNMVLQAIWVPKGSVVAG